MHTYLKTNIGAHIHTYIRYIHMLGSNTYTHKHAYRHTRYLYVQSKYLCTNVMLGIYIYVNIHRDVCTCICTSLDLSMGHIRETSTKGDR